MINYRTSVGSFLLACCLLASPAFAQKHKKKNKKDKDKTETAAAQKDTKTEAKKPKKLDEFVKDFTKQEGSLPYIRTPPTAPFICL